MKATISARAPLAISPDVLAKRTTRALFARRLDSGATFFTKCRAPGVARSSVAQNEGSDSRLFDHVPSA